MTRRPAVRMAFDTAAASLFASSSSVAATRYDFRPLLLRRSESTVRPFAFDRSTVFSMVICRGHETFVSRSVTITWSRRVRASSATSVVDAMTFPMHRSAASTKRIEGPTTFSPPPTGFAYFATSANPGRSHSRSSATRTPSRLRGLRCAMAHRAFTSASACALRACACTSVDCTISWPPKASCRASAPAAIPFPFMSFSFEG